MVVGIVPGDAWGSPGWPPALVAGRRVTRGHYEAMADVATGFRPWATRNHPCAATATRVVGLTQPHGLLQRRPDGVHPFEGCAGGAVFKRQRCHLCSQRASARPANPAFNRPGAAAGARCLCHASHRRQAATSVNAVLGAPGFPGADADCRGRHHCAAAKRFTVFTRAADARQCWSSKLIATSAKQIGMFLVILAAVSAAIVAFIIYTLTMDKIREIAVLKLIGTRNRTIAWMILAAGPGPGADWLCRGQNHAPPFQRHIFPKYVLLLPQDSAWPRWPSVLAICALASVVAIRIALAH
jgi:putative ABC transport system permease protein